MTVRDVDPGDTTPGPLARHVPSGVVVTDVDWFVLYANPAVRELVGGVDELVGRRLPDLFTPASRLYHETHYAPLLRLQGHVREVSADVVTADGRRPVLLGSNAVHDADGEVSSIVTSLVGVEDRHRYEQELLTARRRAEASEARERKLQRVLAELATALTTADVTTVLEHFAGELLGACESRLLLDPPADDDEWVEDDQLDLAHAHRAAQERGVLTSGGQDGLTVVPVPTRTGPSAVLVVRCPDRAPPTLAELDVLRSVGQQAGQVLERARLHEAKDLVLGMVAHDLRTPLATIGGFAETLQRVLDDADPTVGDMLERIRRSTARLGRLTDDLLDTSALQLGRLQLELELQSVAAVVAPVVAGYELLAREKDIALRVDDRSSGAAAPLDADRLVQVVDNLVSNALKYTPPGGHVDVTIDLVTDAVRVQVSDDGPGIPADEVERALSPFGLTRNRPTGAETSTGLGLAIARDLVEAHGGELTVLDGVGATFSFTLPNAAGDDADD